MTWSSSFLDAWWCSLIYFFYFFLHAYSVAETTFIVTACIRHGYQLTPPALDQSLHLGFFATDNSFFRILLPEYLHELFSFSCSLTERQSGWLIFLGNLSEQTCLLNGFLSSWFSVVVISVQCGDTFFVAVECDYFKKKLVLAVMFRCEIFSIIILPHFKRPKEVKKIVFCRSVMLTTACLIPDSFL